LQELNSAGKLIIGMAAKKEQVDVVNDIIHKSASAIMVGDDQGKTALHSAANSERSVRQLILQGADANKVDKDGKTPDCYASNISAAAFISSKSMRPKSWVQFIEERMSGSDDNNRSF
jgi:ankyrin repeat protein